MFSSGLLISAGVVLATAMLDKILESSGFFWLGTILKIAVPLVGMALAVYFLEHNQILRWLK